MCCYSCIYAPAHHVHSQSKKREHISTASTSGVYACDTLMYHSTCLFHAHTFNALIPLDATGSFCSLSFQMTSFLPTQDRLQMPSFQTWRLSSAVRHWCDSAPALSLAAATGASVPPSGLQPTMACSAARRWSKAPGKAKPVWAIDIEYPWCRKSGP